MDERYCEEYLGYLLEGREEICGGRAARVYWVRARRGGPEQPGVFRLKAVACHQMDGEALRHKALTVAKALIEYGGFEAGQTYLLRLPFHRKGQPRTRRVVAVAEPAYGTGQPFQRKGQSFLGRTEGA